MKKKPSSAAPAPAPAERSRRGFAASTLVLAVALSFVCGLLAGTFLAPALQRDGSAAVPQASAPAPAVQAPQASQDVPSVPTREQEARLAELEGRVKANPGDRAALVSLGDLNFDLHRADASIAAYEAALALDANDPDVLTDLGVMYRAAGRYDDALASFGRALEIRPDHPVAMFDRGVVLNYDLHRHDEGLAVWRELLRLHPDAKGPDGTPLAKIIEDASSKR